VTQEPAIRLRDCNVSGAGPEVQLQVTTNCLPALAFADQELSQTAKDGLARAHVLLPKPPEGHGADRALPDHVPGPGPDPGGSQLETAQRLEGASCSVCEGATS
jgi:hypothetical protein